MNIVEQTAVAARVISRTMGGKEIVPLDLEIANALAQAGLLVTDPGPEILDCGCPNKQIIMVQHVRGCRAEIEP